MADASTPEPTYTKLLEVAERAKRDPCGQLFSLAYLLDRDTLKSALGRIRSGAAVGVDGMTKAVFESNLEGNLEGLHEEMRRGSYRHQPIRRVHIPKENGKTRPIGISTIRDKVVQGALRDVLEAIYEQDFLDCSFGFRPNRSAHDALRTLNHAMNRGAGSWVLEIDIKSFFDSLDRKRLMKMLQVRIADKSMLRLVGKCLRVGILDGEEFSWTEGGTTQGSSLSPLLGNVYLHYALDLWFERVVKPRLSGRAEMVRYADDAVFVFEHLWDAVKFQTALGQRMMKFGLELHEEKTRLINFGRPGLKGSEPDTFDFLGFTHYWEKPKGRGWRISQKTKRAGRTRFLKRVHEYCRDYRHSSVKDQHEALKRRIQGYIQYFGVRSNYRTLGNICWKVAGIWKKWLARRSQKSRMNWARFSKILKIFPIPRPRVCVNLWASC